MCEHIILPFILDRTSKINLILNESLHLRGDGWRCGLKNFSIDKKWSLLNEKITILYTNGYKSVIHPYKIHGVSQLDEVLNEMFPKKRQKRDDDIFDDITMNSSDDEVTPPPSVIPLESSPKTKNKHSTVVTPPPSMFPMDRPPSPKKPKLEKSENITVVTYPTDEKGKSGDKQYIVYKNLNEAFRYSPEISILTNEFTAFAHNSIEFSFDSVSKRYTVNFDVNYIRAIYLSRGFARALGFPSIIHNNDVSSLKPQNETLHSHVGVYLNEIVYPIHFGEHKEPVLNYFPVMPGGEPLVATYQRPNYLKMIVSTITEIEIELKDLHGSPIFGDGATGHIILEFLKYC